MDTTKKHLVERANEIGVLFIRERNSKEDLTGWGALEFVLNNGEIFVVSGEQFGQGGEEDGLWVDMNKVDTLELSKFKQKALIYRQKEPSDTISSWLKHQTYKI